MATYEELQSGGTAAAPSLPAGKEKGKCFLTSEHSTQRTVNIHNTVGNARIPQTARNTAVRMYQPCQTGHSLQHYARTTHCAQTCHDACISQHKLHTLHTKTALYNLEKWGVRAGVVALSRPLDAAVGGSVYHQIRLDGREMREKRGEKKDERKERRD